MKLIVKSLRMQWIKKGHIMLFIGYDGLVDVALP
jgi:hypothetical protein